MAPITPSSRLAAKGPGTVSGSGEQMKQQSSPEQRDRDGVGQQLMVEVDHRQGDQGPADQHRGRCIRRIAEAPDQICRDHTAEGLDDRIAQRDRRAAGRAATAQPQPAEQRDVVSRLDLRFAGRAGRAGDKQVESGRVSRAGCRRRTVGKQRAALLAPIPLHHERQAVDHHVQETADQQAEQAGTCCQYRQSGRQQRAGLDQMTAPILKIGRYIAMTRPPTSTPRMAMIIGSSRLLMLSTALSTSAS